MACVSSFGEAVSGGCGPLVRRGFAERDALRSVVVVVTTIGVDFSEQDPQPVVTRLRAAGTPVHAVVMRTSRVRMNFTGTFGLAAFPSWANRALDLMLDIGPERPVDVASIRSEVKSRLLEQIARQAFEVQRVVNLLETGGSR